MCQASGGTRYVIRRTWTQHAVRGTWHARRSTQFRPSWRTLRAHS